METGLCVPPQYREEVEAVVKSYSSLGLAGVTNTRRGTYEKRNSFELLACCRGSRAAIGCIWGLIGEDDLVYIQASPTAPKSDFVHKLVKVEEAMSNDEADCKAGLLRGKTSRQGPKNEWSNGRTASLTAPAVRRWALRRKRSMAVIPVRAQVTVITLFPQRKRGKDFRSGRQTSKHFAM